jgi:hypothetical protein
VAFYKRGGYGDSLLVLSQQTRLPRGVPVHSRLWPGLAECQAAAKPALERRDPFACPKRSSNGGRALDPSRRCGVGRGCEKGGKIGDQRAQRRHYRQLVVLACKMALDHGQSSARLTSPATTGLSAM